MAISFPASKPLRGPRDDGSRRAGHEVVRPTRYLHIRPNAFGFGSMGDSCTSGPALVGVLGGVWRRTNRLRGVDAEDCATKLHYDFPSLNYPAAKMRLMDSSHQDNFL